MGYFHFALMMISTASFDTIKKIVQNPSINEEEKGKIQTHNLKLQSTK